MWGNESSVHCNYNTITYCKSNTNTYCKSNTNTHCKSNTITHYSADVAPVDAFDKFTTSIAKFTTYTSSNKMVESESSSHICSSGGANCTADCTTHPVPGLHPDLGSVSSPSHDAINGGFRQVTHDESVCVETRAASGGTDSNGSGTVPLVSWAGRTPEDRYCWRSLPQFLRKY